MFISNRYKVNFVRQRRYAPGKYKLKNNSGLLRPFIATFNYFTRGELISYSSGSYL